MVSSVGEEESIEMDATNGILDDLRVIDMSSGPTGGLATMVLADFGADVVKVELPGGDPERRQPSSPMWLRGKRSIVLDPASDDDARILRDLCRTANVVVSSDPQPVARRIGRDYETLKSENDRLIYCSVTAWGNHGPYAEYPADRGLVTAKSGRMMAYAGVVPRDGPGFPAVQAETHAAAQSALTGILAAVLAADQTGRGQFLETSLLQGTFPYDLNTLVRSQLSKRYPKLFEADPFASLTSASMPTLGYQPVMGSDGRWIQFANLLEHLFASSIDALDLAADVYGNPDYAGAPRLAPEPMEKVRDLMLERAASRPASDWMEIFHANGNVAAEVVETAQEGLDHPDLIANGEVVELQNSELGRVRQLGPIARLTRTPGQPSAEFPKPDEHRAEIVGGLASRAQPDAGGAVGTLSHPLEGITVVEFATIIAAPLGASLLADLGARVIKVEPTRGGDPMRTMGVGAGAYITASKTTAGKESICVDLKSPEGQEVVHRLLRTADVLIHNYRPGVPERLGIGYELIRDLNPQIIYLSANGYGPDGPSAHRPAAHPIPGAVNGGALMQVGAAWPEDTATLDGIREASRWLYRANEANPDPNTSVVIASSVMLGLYARRRTGEGQAIFVSMIGANGWANFDDFVRYDGKAARPEVDAALHGTSACHRLYRASDGWVFFSIRSDAEWQRFVSTVGVDALSDESFETEDARSASESELTTCLSELFATKAALEWEAMLAPSDVGCVEATTSTAGEFFSSDEQMVANGFNLMATHPLWGEYQRWGPLVRFEGTPGKYGPGVLAGENTDAILAQLGYGDDEVASLRTAGIVDSSPAMPLQEPEDA